MKTLFYLLFWVLPYHTLAQIIMSDEEKLYVTPEDFGCISDNKENAHENSIRMQKSIDFAIEKGLKIVSTSGKKYYIKEGLVIKGPIDIDFNMGTLVATDTFSVIEINDGKARRWGGRIAGLKIDQNKKAKHGIYCKSAVKVHISDCAFIGIPQNGVGVHVEKGYEVFLDDVHLEGGDDKATGIKIDTHDCHFSDCAIINCHTAVDCAGSNFFERIHAWIGSGGKWIDGSTFFRIRGGESIFLHQCFSDTFDKAFEILRNTRVFISQQKNYHNKIMWKRDAKNINPVFFHFKNMEIANQSYIVLDNSYVGGLIVEGENRQLFSNIDGHHIIINNSYIE